MKKQKKNKSSNNQFKVKSFNTTSQPGSVDLIPLYRGFGLKETVKYFDYYFGATAFGSTPTIFTPFSPAQGGARSQRIGDHVRLCGMTMTYTCVCLNLDITNRIRFTGFIWKQDSTLVVPTTAQIYESAATYGVVGPIDHEHSHVVKVFYDHIVTLVGLATAPTSTGVITVTRNIALKGQVAFDAGVTTGMGIPYISIMSDSGVAPSPSVELMCRIWYFTE